MAFQFVQILFWLALATWFGAVLFVAAAAPVIFRTVRESNPVLPGVLSVNLEGQHGTLLAGTIVARILSALRAVQAVCAGILLITLIAHLFILDITGPNGTAAIVRAALFGGAVGMLLYDWLAIAPRIAKFRQQYIDHADEPEIANPAKDRFDELHRRSVGALQIMLFCLLGMILFSAAVSPKSRGTTLHAPPAVQKAD